MNARASFALIAVGLAAALATGCSSSSGGPAASSTPPAAATTTVTAAAPSTSDAVAGSSSPAAGDASSPAPASSTHASTQGASADPGSGSFAAFVGRWSGHGRTLKVDKDGGFTMDFRTYVTCSSTVTSACDRIDGNGITDGGHVTGEITHVINASTVTVTVFSSTDKRDVPDTSFTLGHDIAHHAVAARVGPFAKNAPFCGSGAPNGYCGA